MTYQDDEIKCKHRIVLNWIKNIIYSLLLREEEEPTTDSALSLNSVFWSLLWYLGLQLSSSINKQNMQLAANILEHLAS